MSGLDLPAMALFQLLRATPGDEAVTLLYQIIFGRNPDEGGLSYYATLFAQGDEAKLSVIRELAASDEASRYSLWHADGAADAWTPPCQEANGPAVLLAGIGGAYRRLAVACERLEKIEDLARLTLLSIPEVSGSIFDQLSERLDRLERATAPRQGAGSAEGR